MRLTVPHHRRNRHGAVLLEILIALALFVSSGAVILGAVSTIRMRFAANVDRTIAAHLAATRMAELEAGLTTAERIDGTVTDIVAPSDAADDDVRVAIDEDAGLGTGRWRLVVETERSRFSQLSAVTIRVYDTKGLGTAVAANTDDEVEVYVLRSLVHLRAGGSDAAGEEFEQDEVMRGLDREPIDSTRRGEGPER
ncbi:MAG: hypothetical protein D8M59_02520 [Planctomycetes bacterium]|nr:hypothetical protein [Planctomycetota bacterium]NOG54406.1 hypothetical protein [Planctomycetota bacterium]